MLPAMPRRQRQPSSDDVVRVVSDFLGLPRPVQVAILIVALVIGGVLLFNYYRQQRQSQQQQPPPPGSPTARVPTAPAPPAPPQPQTPEAGPTEVSTGDGNHLLGNPSGATTDPADRSNFLMVKPYYTLAYNSTKGIPNWVSWRLTRADLGPARRKQLFDPDTTLPPGFYRVTHRD